MTEAEWLACQDPEAMLEFLRGKGSDRKLRRFLVACCRAEETGEEEGRASIGIVEDVADGRRPPMDPTPHYYEYHSLFHSSGSTFDWLCHSAQAPCAHTAAVAVVQRLCDTTWPDGESGPGIAWLRDIFGNPFRPVAVDPSWLTFTVVALARGIYDEKAFDRLPILADALMDAGCDNAAVLDHCRGEGPHVRGCWVVDLVLGKS